MIRPSTSLTHPDEMSPAQIRNEITDLLAVGLGRWRRSATSGSQPEESAESAEKSLGGLGTKSVYPAR